MEYSLWTAVTGWTACARRIVSALASDSPKWDLAVGDQVSYGAGYVFDRHVWVDPVLIEQVDTVGPQPLQ